MLSDRRIEREFALTRDRDTRGSRLRYLLLYQHLRSQLNRNTTTMSDPIRSNLDGRIRRPACGIWSWTRLACLLLIVGLVGCKSRVSDSGSTPDGEGATVEGSSKGKIIPVRRNVKSLDGNWVMVVTVKGRDKYIWLVTLKKDAEGKLQGEMIDTANDKLDPQVVSTEVDGNSLKLKLKNKVASIEFDGTFDGIAIRGNLANGPQEIYVGRLLPTDAVRLKDYVDDALPPAADIFMKAIKGMQKEPKPKVILALAREHRTSPVALEAVFGLLSLQARAGFDDATIREIVDQYIELAKIWGTRMQLQAEFVVAQHLVNRLPEDCLKHLDETERLLGDTAAPLKPRIQMYRDEATIQLALARSRSKSDEERTAAHAELVEGLKKQQFNADIMLALGDYCIASKQTEPAIEYYSSIVALPMLEMLILARRAGQPAGDPTPTQVLTKLWTEQHQNADGLPDHLTKLHRDRLAALRHEIRTAGPAALAEDVGDHTVLVEFFTGGQMPQAIATEVGVDTLSEVYPTSRVVILRYHQHIPGPDGLVNQDSEDRLAFYEVARTPLLLLDGAALDPDQVPYGGFLQASPNAYNILRTVVDARLKQSTPIRLELSGAIENGELSISANVTGATEEQLPSLRLRLAIAEETVDAPQPNGIRDHAMVVREMPGGARGIAAKKGALKFSFSMPATDLQQHLSDYMNRYEAGTKIEMPVTMKPPVRGPLHLIGWVQNDKLDNAHPEIGRAVLQTAIVPIQGSVPQQVTEPKASGDAAPAAPSTTTPPAPALPE